MTKTQLEQMIALACKQREHAYAPYSNFRVGAALLTQTAKLYAGCNIENVSYTPTICAERTALYKAISEGEREFQAICIVGGKEKTPREYTPPCGVCLQVMLEFCDPAVFQVVLAVSRSQYQILSLRELLPRGFSRESLL